MPTHWWEIKTKTSRLVRNTQTCAVAAQAAIILFRDFLSTSIVPMPQQIPASGVLGGGDDLPLIR